MINAQCRKCRRRAEKLFLKGERCFSPKCAMVKRPFAPGIHGKKRRRGEGSEFGRQLNEKQKIKNTYGVLERQFKNYVFEAMEEKGDNRENLIRKLETRLDNVVFRSGFARSRQAARQIVSHGHILVNGRRIDIASYRAKIGETISLREKSKETPLFKDLKIILKNYNTPAWLSLDKEKLEGKITALPTIEDYGKDLTGVGMVIEFYSR